MTRADRHELRSDLGDSLRQGLPPIVGDEGGSTWVGGGGSVVIEDFALPDEAIDALYVGIDLLPDSFREQVVLGMGRESGSLMRLTVNAGNRRGGVEFRLQDDEGRHMVVEVQGSRSASKRLLLIARPSAGSVEVFELQPWSASPENPLPVVRREPERLSSLRLRGQLIVGGASSEAVYDGRISELYLGTKALHSSRVEALATASGNPQHLKVDQLGSASAELRDRFFRDLARLRGWVSRPVMDQNGTCQAF